jgi:hypothetical protein
MTDRAAQALATSLVSATAVTAGRSRPARRWAPSPLRPGLSERPRLAGAPSPRIPEPPRRTSSETPIFIFIPDPAARHRRKQDRVSALGMRPVAGYVSRPVRPPRRHGLQAVRPDRRHIPRRGIAAARFRGMAVQETVTAGISPSGAARFASWARTRDWRTAARTQRASCGQCRTRWRRRCAKRRRAGIAGHAPGRSKALATHPWQRNPDFAGAF